MNDDVCTYDLDRLRTDLRREIHAAEIEVERLRRDLRSEIRQVELDRRPHEIELRSLKSRVDSLQTEQWLYVLMYAVLWSVFLLVVVASGGSSGS